MGKSSNAGGRSLSRGSSALQLRHRHRGARGERGWGRAAWMLAEVVAGRGITPTLRGRRRSDRFMESPRPHLRLVMGEARGGNTFCTRHRVMVGWYVINTQRRHKGTNPTPTVAKN